MTNLRRFGAKDSVLKLFMISSRRRHKQPEEQPCILTLQGLLGLFAFSSPSTSWASFDGSTFDGGPRGLSVYGSNEDDSDGSNETPETFRRRTRVKRYDRSPSCDSHDGGSTSADTDADCEYMGTFMDNVHTNKKSNDEEDDGDEFIQWLNAKAAAAKDVDGECPSSKWDPFDVRSGEEEYITVDEKEKFKLYIERGVNLYTLGRNGEARAIILKLERGGEITVEHDDYITTILPRHLKAIQRGVDTRVKHILKRSKDPIICKYPAVDIMKRCFSIILRGTTKAVTFIEAYRGQSIILFRGLKSLIDDKMDTLVFPKIHMYKPMSDEVGYSSDQTSTTISSNSYWSGSQSQCNTPR